MSRYISDAVRALVARRGIYTAAIAPLAGFPAYMPPVIAYIYACGGLLYT